MLRDVVDALADADIEDKVQLLSAEAAGFISIRKEIELGKVQLRWWKLEAQLATKNL